MQSYKRKAIRIESSWRLGSFGLVPHWAHKSYIYIYIYIGIHRKYIGIHRNMQEHIGKHREYIGIHRNIVKYIRICKAIRGRLSGFSLPGGWVHLAMFHIGPISHIYIYIYRNIQELIGNIQEYIGICRNIQETTGNTQEYIGIQ